jgi:hypothetical protein
VRLADFAFSKLEPLWSRNCHIPCSVCATAQEISRTVYILILSKTSCTNTRAGAKALAHKNSVRHREVAATKRWHKAKKHIQYQNNQGRHIKRIHKYINTPAQDFSLGSSSPLCLASHDVSSDICHFKGDDDLESTGLSWLQADPADIRARVVEVATCETPPTLSDRRVETLSRGKPHVGRGGSVLDRRIAEVILDPLGQNLNNAHIGGEY